MISALLAKLPGIGEKVIGLVGKRQDFKARKQEIKFETDKMQHNYLKEKVTVRLFVFIAVISVLPYCFYMLSPLLKWLPFMTEILKDYENIFNTIGVDRTFHIIYSLLGIGGLAGGAAVFGKIKMATKKADNDNEIKKEEIKKGIIGDEHVSIETDSKYQKVKDFVKKFGPMAEEVEKRFGLCAAGVLAHAALESGWGKSILKAYRVPDGKRIDTNNLFNIKKSSTWTGEVATRKVWEVKKNKDINIKQTFKVYKTLQHAFDDYARLLTSLSRYNDVKEAQTAAEYGKALYKGGYMTDNKAPEKIAKIGDMFLYET